MARYINADEALRISKEGRFMWAYDLTDLEEFLTNVPSVDAVEVVRCKDCKHWLKDVAGCTDFVGRCAYANYMIGATGYCLYGERREEA